MSESARNALLLRTQNPDGSKCIRVVFFFATRKAKCLQVLPGLSQLFDLLLYGLTKLLSADVSRCIDGVETVVASWPGVRTCGHRFGGTEFSIAGQVGEFGHIHGCGVIDLKLPMSTIDSLPSAVQRILLPHHIAPESRSWATVIIEGGHSRDGAITTLRAAYEHA